MQTVFQYQKEGDREQISSYVLLSNSPRRKQLLGFLQPQIASVEVDERGIEEHFMKQFATDDFLTRAAKTCCEISKAKSDMDLVTGHLYISADTIVVSDGKIFNKPQDLTEAETMLRSYFGKSHHVVTSVCLRTSHSLDVFIRLHRLILWTIIQPWKKRFSPISVKSSRWIRPVPTVFRSLTHAL